MLADEWRREMGGEERTVAVALTAAAAQLATLNSLAHSTQVDIHIAPRSSHRQSHCKIQASTLRWKFEDKSVRVRVQN